MYVQQDIFQSKAQVIVNTVNTVGVMGKGIAKKYKELYPDMYRQYRDYCENGQLEIGKLWIYKTEDKWILNFPTKKSWRKPSRIEYIEAGLRKFVDTYAEKGIYSISFPQLGCGNGGLEWESEVKPLMEKYLKPLPIDIFIHIYENSKIEKEHLNIEQTTNWLHKNPRSLSIDQVWEDLLTAIGKHNYKLNTFETYSIIVNSGQNKNNSELEKTIILSNNKKTILLTKSDLNDIWIKMRDYGLILEYDLSSYFQNNHYSRTIFQLLTTVSYIEFIYTMNLAGSASWGISINNINLPEGTYTKTEEVNV